VERVETKILIEPWDVNRRLSELCLDRRKLLNVAARALAERANSTPFHCLNAAGTFAYHYGVFALRHEFVPDGWDIDHNGGVESIRLDSISTKISFANVDLACNLVQWPKPRSEKGAGSERATMGNLFGSLPEFAPRQHSDFALYYLMVDDDGNAELTRPIVQSGTFGIPVERIFLGNPNDDDMAELSVDQTDMAENFDPVVVRK
jgi:hypothetical protein